jgi:uncharacterized protein (DUF362 family)
MYRREFIRKGIGAGIVTGSAIRLFPGTGSSTRVPAPAGYDMVAVLGGSPGEMFDRAILALGGMKNFVKANQTVVVKPNIGWDSTPERAACTNPELVARIIEHCFAAGARDVYVVDNTINEWTRCYQNSGIEKAARDAGAKVVTGNSESHYQSVDIKNGRQLKTAKVHELILGSDVFINVPVLKTHGGAIITASMKNLMGIVWDRRYWHENDLHQCIADMCTAIKPDLNVVDAYRVMLRNGPRGVSVEDVSTMKYQIVSTDMVACDAAAAKLMEKDPERIGHIKLGNEMGVGRSDLENLSINRIKISG